MPDSVRLDVLQDIRSVIAAITTAGGYNFNVQDAILGFKHFEEVPESKFPFVCILGADEERENVTNKTFRSIMRVRIIGWVRLSNSDTPAPDVLTEEDKLIQDITKALYVDHTRAGASTYTEVKSIVDSGAMIPPYGGIEMIVEMDYRASFTAP